MYRKYPKVKRKYDVVARLWKELPTDAELMNSKRQALVEEEVQVQVVSSSHMTAYVVSNSSIRALSVVKTEIQKIIVIARAKHTLSVVLYYNAPTFT